MRLAQRVSCSLLATTLSSQEGFLESVNEYYAEILKLIEYGQAGSGAGRV